ncbi:hypothetical protein [Amycolatopsis sp. CA-128772]|uniref:hypothetical protein n=1 Tax=Amycolatopsis sp. CA-128772 TaxID=2073159 RepID=UPI000CD1FD9E|nr:hypothetical protein [Amycolatopsis sp. CA-128772]
MSGTLIGLVFGLALGFAVAFGGFGAFVAVLVLGGLGLLAGRWADGKLDVAALVGAARDRR